jgi:hypothetical protein
MFVCSTPYFCEYCINNVNSLKNEWFQYKVCGYYKLYCKVTVTKNTFLAYQLRVTYNTFNSNEVSHTWSTMMISLDTATGEPDLSFSFCYPAYI